MSTFTTAIAASSDDAFESSGTMDINSFVVNANGVAFYIGLRFVNVTIPAGSTINSATLDLYFTSTAFDDPDVLIYCEDTDDAATFTTSANNISSRALTTANTAWDANAIGTGIKTTPSFSSALQEVIDRAGWASGNDLAVIIKGDDATSLLRASAFDSPNPEAVLNVDYTAGGSGGGQPPRTMHQFRQRTV